MKQFDVRRSALCVCLSMNLSAISFSVSVLVVNRNPFNLIAGCRETTLGAPDKGRKLTSIESFSVIFSQNLMIHHLLE